MLVEQRISRVQEQVISTPIQAIKSASSDLRARPRIHERVIKLLLLLCGAISILTTIGLVTVLGKESLSFFTRVSWEDSNKQIVADLSATAADNVLQVSQSGAAIDSEVIRLDDEELRVIAIEGDTITVERGYNNTEIAPHRAGIDIYTSDTVSLIEFFTGTEWSPQVGKFGVLPLVNATLMTSFIAMLVAIPLGMGAAIYMSEYARPKVRSVIKPVLEILAGIPTVVFGFFALTFMTPLLRSIFGIHNVEIFNTASAGIVVGLLITPLISSMAEDALSAVPQSLREASYGLGATRLETTIKVVLPAATSGIIAAFIVAISRAIGETMIVAIAAGSGPNFTFNPFAAAETMTGHIARISGGDLSYDSIDYNSIFAIGLTLFMMTFVLNVFSRRVIARFREQY